MACPAATVFRNYLCQGGCGQGEEQLDLLSDLSALVENADGRIWRMRNGYALPTSRDALCKFSERLRSDQELRAAAEAALRVGIHADTQVKPPLQHRVAQVFCSALPVAYSRGRVDEVDWEPFARLVLRGAYEATLAVGAAAAATSSGRAKVFLTALGDGAFGNDTTWVRESLEAALDKYCAFPLDVTLVHYGSTVAERWRFVRAPGSDGPPPVDLLDPAAEARAQFASSALSALRRPPVTSGEASDKLSAYLATTAPGTRVAIVTLLGSLCPVTVGHVQMFLEARRLLLGEAHSRPAGLVSLGAVVGLVSLNPDSSVNLKLHRNGEAALADADRQHLVELALQEHPWMAMERREGDTVPFLQHAHPHIEFIHFTMNGADSILRSAKWKWASHNDRMIAMGRPGDTEAVVEGAKSDGIDLDKGFFVMGPELPDISSSAARKALTGGDVGHAATLLHPKVLEWCLQRGPWRPTGEAPPASQGSFPFLPSSVDHPGSDFSVLSYNLLADGWGGRAFGPWPQRAAEITAGLRRAQIDVLCLQEVQSRASGSAGHWPDLRDALTADGTFDVGCFAPRQPHHVFEADASLGCAVLYNPTTFQPEEPPVSGTVALGKGSASQVAAYARLRHRLTGRPLVVAAFHLSSKWQEPLLQVAQMDVLRGALKNTVLQQDDVLVLAGDANSTPSSDLYTHLVSSGLVSAYSAANGSEPAFTNVDAKSQQLFTLDYILFDPTSLAVVGTVPTPRQDHIVRAVGVPPRAHEGAPSDHVPIGASFRFLSPTCH